MTGKRQHKFDNRLLNSFTADPVTANHPRQVSELYSIVQPEPVSSPSLLAVSAELAERLGFSEQEWNSDWFAQVFAGNSRLPGMSPWATCYGGHQFGHWAGQLGDGRAINLGELLTASGEHWTLQLKGAGPTPYSRGADGRAVLRSSLREFLCSEAMYHLGVPTTRALSLVLTGDEVIRDMFYDGNAMPEPGAVVCRAAPSFTRFGHFQLPASRGDRELLEQLIEFTITAEFPHLLNDRKATDRETWLVWFEEVCELTLEMIVHWMRVGFVHGVMNTDNMSILGLTIDYGPYGWVDDYDPDWTPNTTDAQHRRYRFGEQGNIARWNLLQLANALYTVLDDAPALERILLATESRLEQKVQVMMMGKLGLQTVGQEDGKLVQRLHELLVNQETDMTLFFRALSAVGPGKEGQPLQQAVADSFYQPLQDDTLELLTAWESGYRQRLTQDCHASGLSAAAYQDSRMESMHSVNPLYVPRNYLAQEAIDAAEAGDYTLLERLMAVLKMPYTEQVDAGKFSQKRPEWARHRAGCSMLSCSS